MPTPKGPGGRSRTGPNSNSPVQGQAENGTNTPAATESVRPSAALQGWHDLNMAVAKTLPTQLLRAGQLQHATLSALKHHGKVRR